MSMPAVRLHNFYPLFAELRVEPTELPFELGGATQMGQLGDHHNNQDALALISRRSHLVAVISDGCASGGSRHSHNEVGAKFQAMLFADMLDEALGKGDVQKLVTELPEIEERLLADLRGIVTILSAHPETPDKTALGRSFFTATLLAAVIDTERYAVFGCGDGVLRINDASIDLDGQEGRYLSEKLFFSNGTEKGNEEVACGGKAVVQEEGPCNPEPGNTTEANTISAESNEQLPDAPMIDILYEGETADLQRLFLGTDGFLDVLDRYPALLDRLEPVASHSQEGHPGYNEYLVSEFRRKFWYNEEVEDWALTHGAHDDRTFALIRRAIKTESGDECD